MKVIYFSPTCTSQSVVTAIAKGFGSISQEIDLTRRLNADISLQSSDIAVVGVPVYMGRVPKQAIAQLKRIKGNNTPIVTAVVYGNRAYDDALLELNNTCISQGFVVVASGAFIAEHSMNEQIATGRPNENDLNKAFQLGKLVAEKCSGNSFSPIEVKGNYPYREVLEMPIFPAADESCNNCGLCAEQCPVGAISADNCKETNKTLCMTCMRCVKECKTHARQLQLNEELSLFLTKKLPMLCMEEKHPEIFV